MSANSTTTTTNGSANGHNREEDKTNTKSDKNNALNGVQSAEEETNRLDSNFAFSPSPSLEQIRSLHAKFTADRDWDQFHTPRNVLLAMVAEVGELSELFQWRNECPLGLTDWTPKERTALEEELSDCLIYLVRLADRCRVDLPTAVVQKLAKNEVKYPIDRVFGSSKKYTEYQ